MPIDKKSTFVSRKLALGIAAIAGVVGEVLGLAAIQPELFTTASELVGASILGILGIGGYGITKQADIDLKNGGS